MAKILPYILYDQVILLGDWNERHINQTGMIDAIRANAQTMADLSRAMVTLDQIRPFCKDLLKIAYEGNEGSTEADPQTDAVTK